MVSSHQLTFGRQLIVRATVGRILSWCRTGSSTGGQLIQSNERQRTERSSVYEYHLIQRPSANTETFDSQHNDHQKVQRLSATIKTTVSWGNDHYTTENDSQLIHRPLAVTHATTQSFSRSYSPFQGLEGPLSGPWKYPIRRERQGYASTASSGNEGYSTTEEATRI